MVSPTRTPPPPNDAGPAWAIARLFPNQGQWSEEDYLLLNRHTNHLVELRDGNIEVLEMPTKSHQRLVAQLHRELQAHAEAKHLGEALFAPYPVRLANDRFREPDLVFMLLQNASRLKEDYAEGADLVMEVLSEDRRRDLVTKRQEYAEAQISEYWLVDPKQQRITVLWLQGSEYTVHGEWSAGERARSRLLPDFIVEVNRIFSAAR